MCEIMLTYLEHHREMTVTLLITVLLSMVLTRAWDILSVLVRRGGNRVIVL